MNKYPYVNSKGETPPPGSPLTGWVHSDAMIQHACPKCGVSAGFQCEQPNGKKALSPHKERIALNLKRRPACR